MNKLKKHFLFMLMMLGLIKAYAQQPVQFSQYVFNGLAVNPAYAGYRSDWTANLTSRLQWTGIDGAPRTNTLSLDGLTNKDRGNVGLGFMITDDRLGPQTSTSAYLNYSYRLRLDDDDTKRLCFGIAAGLVQNSMNGSQFKPGDNTDASIAGSSISKLGPDFRLGIYYYSSGMYVGGSVLNLIPNAGSNDHSLAVINQVRSLYLTSGVLVPLTSVIDLKPSVMFKEDFRGPTNADLSGFIVFNKTLWLGTSYRTAANLWKKSNLQTSLDKNDAVAAIVQVYLSEHFRIGYSYDFTTSGLAGYQSGSHELSLSLSFGSRNPRILSPRYF